MRPIPVRLAAALLLAASLGACSSVKELRHGPQLTPMAYPAELGPAVGAGQTQMQIQAQALPAPASANSLWRTGSRTFFRDQRASRIGDILTVQIDIKDNASVSNETATDRTTSTDHGISNLFGLESLLDKVLPGSPDPEHLVKAGSTTSLEGKGTVNRSEAVSLTIAAVVSGVLPNGNLVIQGRQEMRINQELRELLISGVVRPEDISAANTIRHTQIAEARVSYGGRGTITRAQKQPFGQAAAMAVSPF